MYASGVGLSAIPTRYRRRAQLQRLDARQPARRITLLLHDNVLTIEVSDAGAGLVLFVGPRPLGADGRRIPAAVDIAQQIGIDGGPWGTTVWARLHFQTGPGAIAA